MIRVYLTNLALYNEGTLHGEWLELPATDEEITDAMRRVLCRPGDEEYFITDYECKLPVLVDEYENLYKLNGFAHALTLWTNAYGIDVVRAVIAATGYTTYTTRKELMSIFEEERFEVLHDVRDKESLGLAATADGYWNGVEIPDALAEYIDYDAIGRDMTYDGWTIVADLEIAVRTW